MISSNSSLSARLDAVIDGAISQRRIVGTDVLVVSDGAVAYRRAAGYADRESGRLLRAGDLFRLASVTKPIVAAAALSLIERGKLALEDPVTKWLGNFRPKLPNGTTPPITVRHLLTHTSGLGYKFFEPIGGPYHLAGVSDGMDSVGISLDENIERLGSVPLLFAPGTQWHYSLSIDVLGAIIERVWGKPLPEAVADLVTHPLEMVETKFYADDDSRLVAAYADGNPEPIRMTDGMSIPSGENCEVILAPSRALDPSAFPSGGAGMVGTVDEFGRFLEALRTGGGPILSQSTVSAALQDQVTSDTLEPNTQGPGWGFGFVGATLTDPIAADTVQSLGAVKWGGAYGHSWFMDLKLRLTVIAFTNTALEGMWGAYPNQIRDAVYESLTA